MFCRHCGHNNPEGNRFCGVCGRLLLLPQPLTEVEPEQVIGNQPVQAPEEGARPVEVRPEPLEAQLEPVEARPVAADEVAPVAAEPAKRNDLWWVDEYKDDDSATISGPSFLGLGGAPGVSGNSYLLQEEQAEEERSHKAAWVLLLVLSVMGGVMYANWRPIRNYVLSTGILQMTPRPTNNAANSGSGLPATTAGAPPATPSTTAASNDAQAPPTSTTDMKDRSKAAEPKTGDAKESLPGSDNEPAASSRTSGKQAEQQQATGMEEKSTDEEKTPPAQRELATPLNEGGELVNSGEKYLYGRGVERSCGQAMTFFKAAAAKQNPQAFSHLGAMYATGSCVPTDRAVAYAWFRRAYAKEPQNRYFEQNLTMLWREMTPDERQRATGRQ